MLRVRGSDRVPPRDRPVFPRRVAEAPGAGLPHMPLEPSDFTRLYRLHAQRLLLYFQRRLLEPEQATDLLAETFAVAIERSGQFRGDTDDQLSAWLWAIARSLLRAAERHGEVERRHAQALGIDRRALERREADRIEELAGLALLRQRVEQQLEQLRPGQREAVRMRMIEELEYEEIAERLGIAEDAVRARVSRGLRELRDRLAGADAEGDGGL
jgi:RNA polymerase sigma-70 factor, ECF subfamily